jgi:hypothetical protein
MVTAPVERSEVRGLVCLRRVLFRHFGLAVSRFFGALAASCGLTHIRDVKAFVAKVMVFDKRRRPDFLSSTTSQPLISWLFLGLGLSSLFVDILRLHPGLR